MLSRNEAKISFKGQIPCLKNPCNHKLLPKCYLFYNSKKETLNIELADWVNDFPADINDEIETTARTVGGTCTADFPQIQIPDMPLDDCYVAQYISNAETNMQKKTDEDLVEIREKVEYFCDVCILVFSS